MGLTRLATISAKVTNFTSSVVSTAYQQMDHAPPVDDPARQNTIIARTLVGGVVLGKRGDLAGGLAKLFGRCLLGTKGRGNRDDD